ncbi:MAG: DUF370 domain-containing protein [Firmicutes bacterium]|jgi:hypothetical protein|nr:DUF370 domain-containing protein [Bacillota bacterium]
MFLHLGGDVVIPLREVISIINIDHEESPLNREFVQTAQDEGFVIQLASDPISCIVTTKNIYLSPISVYTLKKRADEGRWYKL